jgi:hypothetical protein
VQAALTLGFTDGVTCTATATVPPAAASRMVNAAVLATVTAGVGAAQLVRIAGSVTLQGTASSAVVADGAHFYEEVLSFNGTLSTAAAARITRAEAISAFAIAAAAFASVQIKQPPPQVITLSGSRMLTVTMTGDPDDDSRIDLHIPGKTIH